MNNDERNALLRHSWSMAVNDRATLSRLFYSRLFEIAPETEHLFKTDLDAQGKKLVATLAFIIDNIEDQDSLLPVAGDLAKRHVEYNVLPEHYPFVGAALLDTLRDLLGPKFDEPTERAWSTTYETLATHMINTAYPSS